jgi:hypothetical protein
MFYYTKMDAHSWSTDRNMRHAVVSKLACSVWLLKEVLLQQSSWVCYTTGSSDFQVFHLLESLFTLLCGLYWYSVLLIDVPY